MAEIQLSQGAEQIRTPQAGLDAIQFNPQMIQQGGVAIARGLADVAGVTFDIVQRQRQVQDATALNDAELEMQKALVEFSDWQQQNPDESQWLNQWNSRVQTLQSKFGNMPLSPEARLSLTRSFGRFNTQALIDVKASALKQSGQRAQASYQAAVQFGQRTGNFEPARDANRRLVESKVILPEQADLNEQNILSDVQTYQRKFYEDAQRANIQSKDWAAIIRTAEAAKMDGTINEPEARAEVEFARIGMAYDTAQADIDRDPVAAMKKLDAGEYKDLPKDVVAKARKYAEDTLSDYQKREIEQIQDQLATGALRSGQQLKFTWIQSPAEQQKIRAAIDARPLTPAEAAAGRLTLEAAVKNYDPKQDPSRIQMFEITAALERMPAAMVNDLKSTWTDRKEGKPLPPDQAAVADFERIIATQFEPDLKSYLDKDGRINKGDEAKFQQKLDEQSLLLRQFRQEIGPNPTEQQIRDVRARVLSTFKAGDLTRYFSAMDVTGQPPPAKPGLSNQPPAFRNALPVGPGDTDAQGLPATSEAASPLLFQSPGRTFQPIQLLPDQ